MNRHPVRPVTIASICGRLDAAECLRLVDAAAAQKPDLILLPETWQSMEPESMDSAVIAHLRSTARDNSVYILHPTVIAEDGTKTNTALLFDRSGELVGRYDKIYPYWNEFPGTNPGALKQPVIDCDFGKLTVFICFDANFPDIWAEAAQQGAELVVWPSAYAAGRQLAAHAINHHYPIVTCTGSGHCMAFDIDGSRMVDVHGDGPIVQFVTLDLDRCIFHENFNQDKIRALLSECPPRVEVEKRLREEEWFIVRSAQQGVSARQVCWEAGMEELRGYKLRSQRAIDQMRP